MANLQFSIFNFQFISVALLAATASADAPLAVPASGEPFHAELVAADANWQLTFRVAERQYAMPAADLVCWGQCPEQGRAGGLVLADGSLLAAQVVAADKDMLQADSELFGALKLPLAALCGVIFRQSSDPADRDRLLDRVSSLPQADDVPGVRAAGPAARLLLDNGDELRGQLVGIADGVVKFQTDAGPVDVKLQRATAIMLHPACTPTTGQLRAWAGFRDGSRLLATQMLMDGASVKLIIAGQPLAASQKNLVFLQPLGGQTIYLSELKPAEYRQTPFLDLPWPYRIDRNVTGGFLRCGGRLYLKGLGVHSAARLVYELGEGQATSSSPLPLGEGQGVRAKRFAAEVGIDDSTADGGSVQFRVLVDGQEKFASPIIRGGQPPLPVSVDVTGAKKLELLVDYADRADVLDHADWLNARLTQ